MDQPQETKPVVLTPDQILELQSSCVQRLLTEKYGRFHDLLSRDEVLDGNAGVAIRKLLEDDDFFTHKLSETGYLALSDPVVRELLKSSPDKPNTAQLKNLSMDKLYRLGKEAEKYRLEKFLHEGQLSESEKRSLTHEQREILTHPQIGKLLSLQKKPLRDLLALTLKQLSLLEKASVRGRIRNDQLSWDKLSTLTDGEYKIIEEKGIVFFQDAYSIRPEIQITHDAIRAKSREFNALEYLTDNLPETLKPFLNIQAYSALSAEKKLEMSKKFGRLLDMPNNFDDLKMTVAKILKEHFKEFYCFDKTALTLMCIWKFHRQDTLFAKAPRDIMQVIAKHSQDQHYPMRPAPKH